jgi:hypothetical protein
LPSERHILSIAQRSPLCNFGENGQLSVFYLFASIASSVCHSFVMLRFAALHKENGQRAVFYLFASIASSVCQSTVMCGTLQCMKTARPAGHEILNARFSGPDCSAAALCNDTEGGSPNKRR